MTYLPRYKCPHCGRISYNLNDVRHRYCGACHAYADQPRRKPMSETDTKQEWLHAAIKIMDHMVRESQKLGRLPFVGSVQCPQCGTGTVSFNYMGPRAAVFKCNTPGCIEGLS